MRGSPNRKPWPKSTCRSSTSSSIGFGLDALDDEVDGVGIERALEQLGIVAEQAAARRFGDAGRFQLQEAEVPARQSGGVEIEVGDLVDREAEAHLRQAVEVAPQRVVGLRQGALRELEHQRRRQLDVLRHQLDEVAEEAAVGQRVGRDVEEEADIGVALADAPQGLDAAEQQQVVDRRHQAVALRDVEILLRHDHPAVVRCARARSIRRSGACAAAG